MKDWVWTKAYVLETRADDGEWQEMDISFSEDVLEEVGEQSECKRWRVIPVNLKYLGGGS